MQFPESWLREFCNPPLSTVELAETLTMAGLEVEELSSVAPSFQGVVVGEIKEAIQHPNADRLRVCQVDVGDAVFLSIVCGAPNARVGIKVPCAIVGAQLPPGEDGKPFLIKVGKLRGVESQGMLCSARELKLAEDHEGLLELPSDAPVGKNIREYLALDDTLFTLKLTPNLAHALSVHGVAREVSALTGTPLSEPAFSAIPVDIADVLPVKISAPDLCGRFSGRIVRHIDIKAATPRWMLDRLARCGQRGVSPLVDISNYVMFELGRPSHIFDLEKIHGSLDVRWGCKGESLKLLNGSTVELDDQVGVIADELQVESLAGIMGGDATAVSDSTQDVYIESAFWWPKAVAGRSRRFNFSTDAGHRFERGVDPQTTVEHIERITQLVLQICGTDKTVCGPVSDIQVNMPVQEPVTLRIARASKVIGMPITKTQCAEALVKLGLSLHKGDEDSITVTPPSYRFDISIEEDLIEEVVRVMGYNLLPEAPPLGPITPKLHAEKHRSAFTVRRELAALGYQETINFSFVEELWERDLAANPEPIRLINPIASQMSVMRSSLLGSLLNVLKFNIGRKTSRARLFELGRVFLRDASITDSDTSVSGFHQPMHIAGVAYGALDSLQWGRKDDLVDFFDVKGDVEALLAPRGAKFEPATHPAMHPGRCARVMLSGRSIGFVGELHPKWRQRWELPHAPVMFELELDAVLEREVPHFTPVDKQQTVDRDIAIVVSEQTNYADVMRVVEEAMQTEQLRSVVLFDVFRARLGKDGEVVTGGLTPQEKSFALRLTLGGGTAVLTDKEIDECVQTVLQQLTQRLGARLRR
ncbi:phenylalanine--tRNA ligase subunit beta [Acidovorax sp. NCPPB 4044]|uniref:phenylalanine--tRNA ligase subunit beta n=1 Tax=Acidovorax sp. NCPPB 4044 TaxID=2940490 RepID=UPI0023049231|nr:phenylalanine--tRNA ligase subunit beta [Acidovorax sp. NCPPB 4044]MDA8521245.1 phenylalanine--tRNA ligase subunit beta [Acidovorax sp. NCPPB 4044]